METLNKNYLFFILFILFITSCTKKIVKNDSNVLNADSVRYDTIITSNCIVPESLYLELDSILSSDPFIDKNGDYSMYRLLFSTCEETLSFHIEKIISVGEGKMKLIKRFNIDELLGKSAYIVKFCKWITPEIVELNIDGKEQLLNITEMKFEPTPNSPE